MATTRALVLGLVRVWRWRVGGKRVHGVELVSTRRHLPRPLFSIWPSEVDKIMIEVVKQRVNCADGRVRKKRNQGREKKSATSRRASPPAEHLPRSATEPTESVSAHLV